MRTKLLNIVGFFSSLVTALLFGTSVHAMECPPEELRVILTPTMPQKPAGMRRFLNTERNASPATNVVLIGDSITEYWPTEKLSQALGSPTILNWGVSGDRIQNVLWRLEHGRLGELKPKALVIMVGVNNLQGDSAQACAVAEGTSAVISKAKAVWPSAKVVVIDMLPFGRGYLSKDEDRKAVHAQVRERFSKDSSVAFLNLDDLVTCGVREMPSIEPANACGAPESLCKFYRPDNIHLSSEGYDVITPVVANSVEASFPD